MSFKSNIQIGTIRGIPIRVDWTFILLLAVFGYKGLDSLLFFTMVFGCVVLHEIAHSLTAMYFKIKVESITLYFFGGCAEISEWNRTREEFLITLAGPMVNLVIVLLILAVNLGFALEPRVYDDLMMVNLLMLVFNLIPAYPMDGGRLMKTGLELMGMRKQRIVAIVFYTMKAFAVIFMAGAIYLGSFNLGFISAILLLLPRKVCQVNNSL